MTFRLNSSFTRGGGPGAGPDRGAWDPAAAVTMAVLQDLLSV